MIAILIIVAIIIIFAIVARELETGREPREYQPIREAGKDARQLIDQASETYQMAARKRLQSK